MAWKPRLQARGLRIAVAGAALMALAACSSGPGETGGALLGGAAGGVLGSQIGSGTGQLVATGAGAGLGALAGASVGRSIDRPNDVPRQRTYASTYDDYWYSRHGHRMHAGYGYRPARAYRSYDDGYGYRRSNSSAYDPPRRPRPVSDVQRQVAIPGAKQTDDSSFWDFLVTYEPIVRPQVQQAAVPSQSEACTRSDRPTLKPVYVCTHDGVTYVRQ